MKYRFRVLTEAEFNERNDDYNKLLEASARARRKGKVSFDNIMKKYVSLGGKFARYYKSKEIRDFVIASIESVASSTSKSDDIRNISTERHKGLYFLTRFDEDIKKSPIAYPKIAFEYRCFITNKIPQRALKDNIWQRQIFDNMKNYEMDNNDFIDVFCAYTLSFAYEDFDPNDVFIKGGHFVNAREADKAYRELKKSKATQKDDVAKNMSNKEILFALTLKFYGEDGCPNNGNINLYATYVGFALFPDADISAFIRTKTDFESPKLTLPKGYEKMKNDELIEILSKTLVYKEYFGIV